MHKIAGNYDLPFFGSSYGFGAFGFLFQAETIASHFFIISGENIADICLNISVCFALILYASSRHFANKVPLNKHH